jgi:hypothetical protein
MDKLVKIIEITKVGDGSVLGTMIKTLELNTNYKLYFWVICVNKESISRTTADCEDLGIEFLICDRNTMSYSKK